MGTHPLNVYNDPSCHLSLVSSTLSKVSKAQTRTHPKNSLGAMAGSASVNCSGLDVRTSFAAYIATLETATHDNYSLVIDSKEHVCTALWGSENADISGIGVSLPYLPPDSICSTEQMIIGYITATILGFIAAISFYTTLRHRPKRDSYFQRPAAAILTSYHDSATFFTFSIQIACLVVLVRADYGISAASMGAATVQITWTVSLLTLLPLIYGIVLLAQQTPTAAAEATASTSSRSRSDRDGIRLFLFIVCWLLACYPFLSRMIESYGASAIGGGAGQLSLIAAADWTVNEDRCLSGVDPVSTAETQAMNAFGIIGFLLVSIFALTIVVASGLQRHYPHVTAQLAARLL